jgi:hypothetical protein
MMAEDASVLTWATAKSTHSGNGRVVVFRYAENLNPAFDRKCQPDRIIVVWKYHSDSGMPFKEEHARMNKLEDALALVIEKEGFATLALVSTGENLREWTYYARSEDEFMARLNYAFIGEDSFPIEIHIESDPEWSMYEKFRAGIKQQVE